MSPGRVTHARGGISGRSSPSPSLPVRSPRLSSTSRSGARDTLAPPPARVAATPGGKSRRMSRTRPLRGLWRIAIVRSLSPSGVNDPPGPTGGDAYEIPLSQPGRSRNTKANDGLPSPTDRAIRPTSASESGRRESAEGPRPSRCSVQVTSDPVAFRRSASGARACGGPSVPPRGSRDAGEASGGPIAPHLDLRHRSRGVPDDRNRRSPPPEAPKDPVRPGGSSRRASARGPGRLFRGCQLRSSDRPREVQGVVPGGSPGSGAARPPGARSCSLSASRGAAQDALRIRIVRPLDSGAFGM